MSQSSSKKLAQSVLQLYGISVQKISDSQTGYRNHSFKVTDQNNHTFNLMVFKAEPYIADRIKRADTASQAVSDLLPVRTRIDERIVKITRPSGDSYAALYNYLPGSTIEWDDYTKDRLKVLGLALARLHTAFAQADVLSADNAEFTQTDVYTELSDLSLRIKHYFEQKDVAAATKEKLGITTRVDYAVIDKALEAGKKLSSQHTLHMDFVRGNILFSTTSSAETIDFGTAHISGIIDFEKTSYGSPLFDVARTLAFLYVDCKYKTAEKIKQYFLYSGYIKHGSGIVSSHKLLEHYVKFFLLHDFYKFLLHNPYESLQENSHYLRTRDILIRYNMVEYRAED
jgi:Ser/Thr protein kinase RdoA (MazF antagonist)